MSTLRLPLYSHNNKIYELVAHNNKIHELFTNYLNFNNKNISIINLRIYPNTFHVKSSWLTYSIFYFYFYFLISI